MNDRENRIYNAGANGHQALANHAPDYLTDTALKNKQIELGLKLNQIDATKIKQQASTKGQTSLKGQAYFKMMFTAWQIARLIVAYAKSINNAALSADLDFSRSDFVHKDFGAGETLAKLVQTKGASNQVAMLAAGFQLTPPMVTALGANITAFDAVKNQPEATASDIVAATTDLKQQVSDLRPIFDSIFDLMVSYASSNVSFYNAVNDAFQINDTGVRHIACRVAVNDSFVLVRLPNAEVTIVELNIVKNTSNRGIADFSQLELVDGNYTVQVKLAHYTTVTINNVRVENGVMSRVDVLLVKV